MRFQISLSFKRCVNITYIWKHGRQPFVYSVAMVLLVVEKVKLTTDKADEGETVWPFDT